MRVALSRLVGRAAAAAVVVFLLSPPAVEAEPPADGFYRARVGEATPPGASSLGEALSLRVDHALLRADDNENEAFSLHLRVPYDATLSHPGTLLLAAGGTIHVSAGAGASGTTWSHPTFSFRDRTSAEAVAKLLGIPLRLRRHPGHRLHVSFVPSKPVFAPGEAVRATFRMENVGETPVTFEQGGRNRAARDNQYDFLARLAGRLVPDVGTSLHMGGIVHRRVLAPGQTFEDPVDLGKWFAFAERGLYEIVGTYALTLLDPATEDHVTLWEDYATAYFLVDVEGAREAKGPSPSAAPATQDPEGAVVGAWSDVVGMVRGRLVTALDDRDRGSSFISIYLEVQHVHYSSSDVEIPADRHVEIEVVDADGKPIPSHGTVSEGPMEAPAPIVLPNYGRVRHRVSDGGCGSSEEAFIVCFRRSGSWTFAKDDRRAYYVRGTMRVDGEERRNSTGRVPWRGRLDLPATRIDLDPN